MGIDTLRSGELPDGEPMAADVTYAVHDRKRDSDARALNRALDDTGAQSITVTYHNGDTLTVSKPDTYRDGHLVTNPH